MEMTDDISLLLSQTQPSTSCSLEVIEGPSRRPEIWTYTETKALLSAWADDEVQGKFETTVRNRSIWETIASQMRNFGYERIWTQCKTKIHNLDQKYKKIKDGNTKSGNGRHSFDHFDQIDLIMGDRPSVQPNVVLNSLEDSLDDPSTPGVAAEPQKDEPILGDGASRPKKRKSSTLTSFFEKFSEAMAESDRKFLLAEERRCKEEREQEEKRLKMEENFFKQILEKL